MIVVAGFWELGYNTPIMEKDLWIYPMRDFGVDEIAMMPVSGIKEKNIKEFENIQSLLEHYKDLPLIILDEDGEENLKDFKHPDDALYLLGKANYSALGYKDMGTTLKIETPNHDKRRGMLWPHQAISITLYDKYLKSVNN